MSKYLFPFVLYSLILICYALRNQYDIEYFNRFTNVYFNSHKYIIGDFVSKRMNWSTSNLGSILFKNQHVPRTKTKNSNFFVILIWEHWDLLKIRHVYNFKSKRIDPFHKCTVRNCGFVGSDDYMASADAVLVHLHHGYIPKVRRRNPNQRWVFLSDESPLNTFGLSNDPPKLSQLANIFNWSMTYRSDADVPVPYGRTLPLSKPIHRHLSNIDVANLVPHWKEKQLHVLVAVLISDCKVAHRMRFIKQLKMYIAVDIHGKCSDYFQDSCPGYFTRDCKVISKYLFYLVLENSMCSQYISEKAFYHAYFKGAIPIIQGVFQEDCMKLLPPNSYLHVDNYATVKDLAEAIIHIANNEDTLLSYHFWRNNFEVLNEHGYFGSKSFHLCRLCEALNYNDGREQVYSEDDLRLFLDPKILCRRVS